MNQRFVYLGGPVLDCTDNEANTWRKVVADELRSHNIIGISPLRCEPPGVDGTYKVSYPDPKFGTPRAILSKNMNDVRMCDMMLAYIPAPLGIRHHSWGTMAELSWATILNKPAILVSDCLAIRAHPVLSEQAGWVVETLDEATDILVGILGAYTGGKNV